MDEVIITLKELGSNENVFTEKFYDMHIYVN